MRILLLLWLGPIGGFWTWHLLASNGIYFSREFHGEIFDLYGQVLGIDPDAIPSMLARALMVDAVLVAGVIAFRKRRAIVALIRSLRARDAKGGPALLEG